MNGFFVVDDVYCWLVLDVLGGGDFFFCWLILKIFLCDFFFFYDFFEFFLIGVVVDFDESEWFVGKVLNEWLFVWVYGLVRFLLIFLKIEYYDFVVIVW